MIDRIKRDTDSLEIVLSDGREVTFRQLFMADWNSGKCKWEVGEHTHKPSDSNTKVRSKGWEAVGWVRESKVRKANLEESGRVVRVLLIAAG